MGQVFLSTADINPCPMLSAIVLNCFFGVNIFKLMADEILPPWWTVMIIAQHQIRVV